MDLHQKWYKHNMAYSWQIKLLAFCLYGLGPYRKIVGVTQARRQGRVGGKLPLTRWRLLSPPSLKEYKVHHDAPL